MKRPKEEEVIETGDENVGDEKVGDQKKKKC